MGRDELVVIVFPNEPAARQGVDALRGLRGGVVVFAAAVLAGESLGLRALVACGRSGSNADLSRRIDAPCDTAAAEHRLSDADRSALAGILAILPRGQAAVVAEVFAPLPLERRMTALGGRVIHRRPLQDRELDCEAEPMSQDTRLAARITMIEDRLSGATQKEKTLLTERLEQLRTELSNAGLGQVRTPAP